MAKKKPTSKPELPRTVTIDGVRHRVVHESTTTWTEQLPDGRLVHHPGKILAGQTVGRWLDTPKPCTVCKQPSWTATPRGRSHHDTCEGWLHVLPDDIEAQVIFGVAADLGADILTPPSTRKEIRRAA